VPGSTTLCKDEFRGEVTHKRLQPNGEEYKQKGRSVSASIFGINLYFWGELIFSMSILCSHKEAKGPSLTRPGGTH
jgi:hypothetical protein